MRVGVDAALLVGRLRGMGTYTKMLTDCIKHEALFFIPREASLPGYPNVAIGGSKIFPIWEQYDLPRHVAKAGVEYILSPYNTAPIFLPKKAKQLLVVHDLIFMENNALWGGSATQSLGAAYRRLVLPRVIRKARRVLTVSEYSKMRMLDMFGLDAPDIEVIPNTIGDDWLNLSELPRENYIFAVSGNAPSKNLRRLLVAFSLLVRKEPGLILKVAGVPESKHFQFKGFVESLSLNGQVEFLGYLDDAAMKLHYSKARLFVCASLFEGFGIPLLEAMATNTPLAVSNSTSLPEVAGDAGWYFDPTEPEDICTAMYQALTNQSLRDLRVQAGGLQVRKFARECFNKKAENFWKSL